MAQKDNSNEAKTLNRRKVLSALGASTVSIAGLGVGSASAQSGKTKKADLRFEDISKKKAKEIVESNAMGVLKTLRNQGIIDQARLSELKFKPLEANELVSSNGFVAMNPPSPNKEGRMSILLVKNDVEKGEINIVVNRDSGEAHAALQTDDETIIYHENNSSEAPSRTNELSPNRLPHPDCEDVCGTSLCRRTWANPFDHVKVHLRWSRNKNRCVMTGSTCC